MYTKKRTLNYKNYMKKLQPNKEIYGMSGKYRITKFSALTGEVRGQSEWNSNLVVSSNGYGRNLIARQMAGDNTYPIEIDQMTLSTNDTTPANTDTSLGGTEINVPVQILTLPTTGEANILSFSAFFTNNELPNNTYHKIGVKMNGRLFTSAMLPTAETKDEGEEYRVDYEIILS